MAKTKTRGGQPARDPTLNANDGGDGLYVRKLAVAGFRGLKNAELLLGRRTVLVGPNACGKSTVCDALALTLGRTKLVRALTENDFYGGNPGPADRFRIVLTICGFATNDPTHYQEWFRAGRAVPKWVDESGVVHAEAGGGRELCAELGLAGRFDAEELEVETVRFFCDDVATTSDPFDDAFPVEIVPHHLVRDLGLFVLPARRGWESTVSFASDLFRRTVSNAAGLPASEILALRDELRNPSSPIERSPRLASIIDSINVRLSGLLVDQPKLQLRLTAADAEAVLTALTPHYAMVGRTLPASRHGSGLLSLQTLLLLLEVGRLRAEQRLNFILALEEPELHLSPGLQTRLVTEANRSTTQTIATTHSARVAATYAATDVRVLHLSEGILAATPLLSAPLPPSATNFQRKLFHQNKAKLLDAVMHPFVLVPEGRLDVEWLARLAPLGEAYQSEPPFTSVYGLAPTEDAQTVATARAVRELRPGVVTMVDGDRAGRDYEQETRNALPDAPCIGWPDDWTIEDVVGWIVDADGSVLPNIASALPEGFSVANTADLVALLKLKNDKKTGTVGLKDDLLAHDALTGQLTEPCLRRIGLVLDALVAPALGRDHPNMSRSASDGATFRFQP